MIVCYSRVSSPREKTDSQKAEIRRGHRSNEIDHRSGIRHGGPCAGFSVPLFLSISDHVVPLDEADVFGQRRGTAADQPGTPEEPLGRRNQEGGMR